MSELIHQSDKAGTDPSDPSHPQAQQPAVTGQSTLAKLIAGQRIAMLSSAAPDGSLDSKPMTLLEFDADGVLWFFCERPAQAAGHEDLDRRYQRVNLSFSDEVRSVFVSITGRGELSHDAARIRALWTEQARPYFPEGPESPNLAVLKVTPERSDFWEAPESHLVRGAMLSVGG